MPVAFTAFREVPTDYPVAFADGVPRCQELLGELEPRDQEGYQCYYQGYRRVQIGHTPPVVVIVVIVVIVFMWLRWRVGMIGRVARGRGNVLEQAGVKMANAKPPSFKSRDAKEGKYR